ncbi:uncharacterized protein FFNC_15507 [Fusarium fujikuroi]|nr:uncharacterized protein FFNC_15507 [Fusarium fujikuroi]
MSFSNATNGVTTIIMPSSMQNAGNINVKLLPPPVGVIYTIGPSPRTTVQITASCNPRNSADSPIICFNCPLISALCNRSNRRLYMSSRSISNSIRPRFNPIPPLRSTRSSAPNPKNACHLMLTV